MTSSSSSLRRLLFSLSVPLLHLLIVGLFCSGDVSAHPNAADEPSRLTLRVNSLSIDFEWPLLGEPDFKKVSFSMSIDVEDSSGKLVDHLIIGNHEDHVKPPERDRGIVRVILIGITHAPLLGHEDDYCC